MNLKNILEILNNNIFNYKRKHNSKFKINKLSLIIKWKISNLKINNKN